MTPVIAVDFAGSTRFLRLHTAAGGVGVDADQWFATPEEAGNAPTELGSRVVACAADHDEIKLVSAADDIEPGWQRALWGVLLYHLSVTLYEAGVVPLALRGAAYLVQQFADDVPACFQRAETFGTAPTWIGTIFVLRDLPVIFWDVPQFPDIRTVAVYPPEAPATIQGIRDKKIIITVQISGVRLDDPESSVVIGDCPQEVVDAVNAPITEGDTDAVVAQHPEVSVLYAALAGHDVLRQLCLKPRGVPGSILTAFGVQNPLDA